VCTVCALLNVAVVRRAMPHRFVAAVRQYAPDRGGNAQTHAYETRSDGSSRRIGVPPTVYDTTARSSRKAACRLQDWAATRRRHTRGATGFPARRAVNRARACLWLIMGGRLQAGRRLARRHARQQGPARTIGCFSFQRRAPIEVDGEVLGRSVGCRAERRARGEAHAPCGGARGRLAPVSAIGSTRQW